MYFKKARKPKNSRKCLWGYHVILLVFFTLDIWGAKKKGLLVLLLLLLLLLLLNALDIIFTQVLSNVVGQYIHLITVELAQNICFFFSSLFLGGRFERMVRKLLVIIYYLTLMVCLKKHIIHYRKLCLFLGLFYPPLYSSNHAVIRPLLPNCSPSAASPGPQHFPESTHFMMGTVRGRHQGLPGWNARRP